MGIDRSALHPVYTRGAAATGAESAHPGALLQPPTKTLREELESCRQSHTHTPTLAQRTHSRLRGVTSPDGWQGLVARMHVCVCSSLNIGISHPQAAFGFRISAQGCVVGCRCPSRSRCRAHGTRLLQRTLPVQQAKGLPAPPGWQCCTGIGLSWCSGFGLCCQLPFASMHSGWAIERLNDWTVGRLDGWAVGRLSGWSVERWSGWECAIRAEQESPVALPVVCARIRIRFSVRLSSGVCVCQCVYLYVCVCVCLLSVANGARASVCVSVWLCACPCLCVCAQQYYISLYTNTSVAHTHTRPAKYNIRNIYTQQFQQVNPLNYSGIYIVYASKKQKKKKNHNHSKYPFCSPFVRLFLAQSSCLCVCVFVKIPSSSASV